MFSFLTKKKVKNDNFLKICFTGHRPKRLPWEQSDVVIAGWNEKPSGSSNTVKMAKQSGKKIRVVNPYNLA